MQSGRERGMRGVAMAAVLLVPALGAIAGALAGGAGWWLHWLCKPAATLWLVVWLARQPAHAKAGHRYRGWVLGGLGLSLLGDVLLMLPQGLFVPGLVAFALAHLCYIAGFAGGLRLAALVAPAGLMAVVAGGNLVALWPQLPADMRLPVSIYVVLIGAMASLALARWRSRLPGGGLAAAGALLFLLSDSLLAWDRFAGPLPAAIAAVLLSYWAAQALIALSATASTGSPAVESLQ